MANSFLFNIDANDLASAKLEQVQKRINALKPRSDVLDATAKLAAMQKKVADASGLGRMVGAFNGLGRATLGVFQNVARIVTPLSAIAGAASIAGMYRLTEVWANFGSQLGFAAQRIGISGERLQSLQGAARLAGSSAEGLTGGLQTLGQTMFDAIGGRAPEAVIMFNKLGVAFRDSSGHARNVSDVLPELADKIKGIRDPYAQAMVAQTMFGASAEEMLPFLRRGSAGIADLTKVARDYGVMNDKGIAAANDLREAHAKLSLAVDGLGYSIAEGVSPALTPLLTQFADWIAKNREWIATGISDKVGEFVKWIKSIDWKAVGKGIGDFADKAQGVVDHLGGWKDAATDLMVFIGGAWLTGMMAPIVQIAAAMATIGVGGSAVAALGATSALIGLGAAGSGTTTGVDDIESGFNWRNQDDPITHWWHETKRQMRKWAFGAPALSDDVDKQVRDGASKSGLDPERMVALFRAEGGGYDRTSSAGAFGPSQLMPGTARDMGVATSPNAPGYSWQANVLAGERYFKQLLQKSGGDYDVASAAYNAGPNNVGVQHFNQTGDPGWLPAETKRYITNINGMMPAPSGAPAGVSAPIAKGAPVNIGDGTGASGAPGAAGPNGKAELTVRLDGFPAGTRTSATASGDAFAGAPRVERAMASTGP